MGPLPHSCGGCSGWQISPRSLPQWVLSCDIQHFDPIAIPAPFQEHFQGSSWKKSELQVPTLPCMPNCVGIPDGLTAKSLDQCWLSVSGPVWGHFCPRREQEATSPSRAAALESWESSLVMTRPTLQNYHRDESSQTKDLLPPLLCRED